MPCEYVIFFAQQNKLMRAVNRLDSTPFSCERGVRPWTSLFLASSDLKTIQNGAVKLLSFLFLLFFILLETQTEASRPDDTRSRCAEARTTMKTNDEDER